MCGSNNRPAGKGASNAPKRYDSIGLSITENRRNSSATARAASCSAQPVSELPHISGALRIGRAWRPRDSKKRRKNRRFLVPDDDCAVA
jgi:hypothetical protein